MLGETDQTILLLEWRLIEGLYQFPRTTGVGDAISDHSLTRVPCLTPRNCKFRLVSNFASAGGSYYKNLDEVQDFIKVPNSMSTLPSTTTLAHVIGIESIAPAIVFAILYVPLLAWFVLQSIKRPTYVYVVLALFCSSECPVLHISPANEGMIDMIFLF